MNDSFKNTQKNVQRHSLAGFNNSSQIYDYRFVAMTVENFLFIQIVEIRSWEMAALVFSFIIDLFFKKQSWIR